MIAGIFLFRLYQSSLILKHMTSTPKKPKKERLLSNVENISGNKKRKLPSECPVSVEVEWSTEKRKKHLHPDLSSLGKMLCRGTFRQIAKAAWNCKPLKKHFYEEIAKQIHKECIVLCQKGSE